VTSSDEFVAKKILTCQKSRDFFFTSSDFGNLDGLQVSGGFQPQNSIDGHVTEEVLVGGQDFGAQSCPENGKSIQNQSKLLKSDGVLSLRDEIFCY
jgi:hypothetical protein